METDVSNVDAATSFAQHVHVLQCRIFSTEIMQKLVKEEEYIIDRVGFEEYKKWALEGVELMPETIMKHNVYWNGIHFDR